MDEETLGLPSLATGADVFDGRGRSAPVGAQAAGWGEARIADLADMGLLAGVTATGLRTPEKTVRITVMFSGCESKHARKALRMYNQ